MCLFNIFKERNESVYFAVKIYEPIPQETMKNIEAQKQDILSSKNNSESPVIVYSREAANRLLSQGFQIISVEKNTKRRNDSSIFLFAPNNGITMMALTKILNTMKEEKELKQRFILDLDK